MKKETVILIMVICICIWGPCYSAYANPRTSDQEENPSAMKSYGNIQYESQEGSVKIFGEDIALLEAKIMSVYEGTFAPQNYSSASQMISTVSVEPRINVDDFLEKQESDTFFVFTDEKVIQEQEPEQEQAYDRIENVDEYDTGSEISGIIFEPEEEEVIESVSENSISANSITADVSEECKGEDSL